MHRSVLDDAILTFSSFIHAQSSRDSLAIAKEQLLYILTHYQVMPAFLDHVIAFCIRLKPHLQASLEMDDRLQIRNPALKLDELGRSGIQLQHCFNLIGVEYDLANPKWPYLFRQTAAYYSFDLIGGQAFWIILKANDEVRTRIQKLVDGNQRRRYRHDLETIHGSFASTLDVHLLIFGWCIENWSSYIEFLHNKTQQPRAQTMSIPISRMTGKGMIAKTAGVSMAEQTSYENRLSGRCRSSWPRKFGMFGLPSSPRGNPPQIQGLGSSPSAVSDQISSVNHASKFNIEELFPFDRLQELHRHSERLEEAALVLRQNKKVIAATIQRFEGMQSSAVFCTTPKASDVEFEVFLRRAHTYVGDLESAEERLSTTISSVERIINLVCAPKS